jgi:hypothetical protein
VVIRTSAQAHGTVYLVTVDRAVRTADGDVLRVNQALFMGF